MSKPALTKGYELQGYVPGDDPAQAEHDERLAALTPDQIEKLVQGIKDLMARKDAEAGALSNVTPFRPKR